MTSEVPLIFTTKGNLPVDSLMHLFEWIRDGGETTYREIFVHGGMLVRERRYTLGANGEELGQAVGDAIDNVPHALIYTKLGNLPIASLEHRVIWEDTPSYTKLRDVYLLAGEVVKESAHVLTKQGLAMEGEQAKL